MDLNVNGSEQHVHSLVFDVVCTMPDSHIYVTALWFSTLVLHDGLFYLL